MHPVSGVNWMSLLILGLCFGLFMLGAWWQGARRRQERKHAERMKAMEMGLPVPPHDSLWPRALTCIAIGAGAPVGIVFIAWLASLTSEPDVAIQGTVWGVAFLISTVAIGCGTGLAFGLLGSQARADERGSTAKPPAFDPDSFEMAHPRG